jgi:flagellar protein FlbD
MIVVTRLNGAPMALNSDLIERAEETPDTVLTLVDGTKYVINESVEELIDKIREYRASVLALAGSVDVQVVAASPRLHVVPTPPTEN